MSIEHYIPLISLLVALLAVFVGPMVTLRVAKKQIDSARLLAINQMNATLAVAGKQITAPMRQAWINTLRDLLAEVSSSALHFYVAGYEDRKDEEYQRLTHLQAKIALMLNPNEEDHRSLEQAITRMMNELERDWRDGDAFPLRHDQVQKITRAILKREWNVIKKDIQIS